jgi:S-adenosylmethionine synthetase
MSLIKRMAKKFPKFSESQSFTAAMTNRDDDSILIEAHTVDESPSLILHIDDAKYAKEVAKSLSSFGAEIAVSTVRKQKIITIIGFIDSVVTPNIDQDKKFANLAASLAEDFKRHGYWFIY